MPLQEVFSLLGILLVLVLVLAGSYLFTRWAGKGLGGRLGAFSGNGRMRVLERLAVGRYQSLLVVQIASRYFVVGSSPSGFSLLTELTEEEGALWTSAPARDAPAPAEGRSPDFRALLRQLRDRK